MEVFPAPPVPHKRTLRTIEGLDAGIFRSPLKETRPCGAPSYIREGFAQTQFG